MSTRKNQKPTANDHCVICDGPYAHLHEIYYGTLFSDKSKQYGFQIRLCQYHHQDNKAGVHNNKHLRTLVYAIAETAAKENGLEVMDIFGLNYNTINLTDPFALLKLKADYEHSVPTMQIGFYKMYADIDKHMKEAKADGRY